MITFFPYNMPVSVFYFRNIDIWGMFQQGLRTFISAKNDHKCKVTTEISYLQLFLELTNIRKSFWNYTSCCVHRFSDIIQKKYVQNNIMLYTPVFPPRIFRLGQIYKFVHKSWWPCAKSISFWLRNSWMNKKCTFLSLFLKILLSQFANTLSQNRDIRA